MDAESVAHVKKIDVGHHWIDRADDYPCRLEVQQVWENIFQLEPCHHAIRLFQVEQINQAIARFNIRTQCGHVSVQVPRILYFKARVSEFANQSRVSVTCVLPELPGGVTTIIRRYADEWVFQYPQFIALLKTAFHADNVTCTEELTVRYLDALKMTEVGECLCFSFG